MLILIAIINIYSDYTVFFYVFIAPIDFKLNDARVYMYLSLFLEALLNFYNNLF